MSDTHSIAQRAREASHSLQSVSSEQKSAALHAIKKALSEQKTKILEANEKDLQV